MKSVRDCAKMVQEKESKVDALYNNAGVMFIPKSFTQDGIETHWSTNHLGHYLLTRLLTNELINGGKVIYMVDLGYRKAEQGIKFNDLNGEENYDMYYAFYQSQLANVLTIQALAKELQTKNITVNGVYPGIVRDTEIRRYTGRAKSYVSQKVANPFLSLAETTPQLAINTPLFLLNDESVEKITGKLFYNLKEKDLECELAHDLKTAEKLMLVDDYWSGLKTKEEVSIAAKQNTNKS